MHGIDPAPNDAITTGMRHPQYGRNVTGIEWAEPRYRGRVGRTRMA